MRGSLSKPIPEEVAVSLICKHWKVEVAADINALTDAFISDLSVPGALGLWDKVRFRIASNVTLYRTGQCSLTHAADSILRNVRTLCQE
jgi:hypothetical protein